MVWGLIYCNALNLFPLKARALWCYVHSTHSKFTYNKLINCMGTFVKQNTCYSDCYAPAISKPCINEKNTRFNTSFFVER